MKLEAVIILTVMMVCATAIMIVGILADVGAFN